MGNAPPTSSTASARGCDTKNTVDDIFGVVRNTHISTIEAFGTKKNHLPFFRRRQRRFRTRKRNNQNDPSSSLLMRFILAQDWQEVLMRARLVPDEIRQPCMVELPVPLKAKTQTTRSDELKCADVFRLRLLPIHAACTFCPPPEVIQALLAISSPEPARVQPASKLRNSRHHEASLHGCQPRHKSKSTSSLVLWCPDDNHPTCNKSLAAISITLAGTAKETASTNTTVAKTVRQTLHGLRKHWFIHNGSIRGNGSRRRNYSNGYNRRWRLPPYVYRRSKALVITNEFESLVLNHYDSSSESRSCGSGSYGGYAGEDDSDTTTVDKNHAGTEAKVARFLQQMEDHLARNRRDGSDGNCKNNIKTKDFVAHCHRRRTRDASASSVVVLDFDPAVLLTPPSTVSASQKERLQRHSLDSSGGYKELLSTKDSIGDLASTNTATPPLVESPHDGNDYGSSSVNTSLVYRTDGHGEPSDVKQLTSESTTSLKHGATKLAAFLEANRRCYDSGNQNGRDSDSSEQCCTNEDHNSFLQLTLDGGLTVVDMEDNDEYCEPERGKFRFLSPGDGSSVPLRTSPGNPEPPRTHAHPQIQFDPVAILQSLPRPELDRNKHEAKTDLSSGWSNGGGLQSCQVLPIHIACLYGASSSVLKILLEEYPEGSSTEVLGMLPVHMVAANWFMSRTLTHLMVEGGSKTDDYFQGGEHSIRKDQLETLLDHTPRSLWTKSTAHGLRPLEYTKILLRDGANQLDENIVHSMKYLEAKENEYESKAPLKTPVVSGNPANCVEDSFAIQACDAHSMDGCSDRIDTVSTCTTSASTWMAPSVVNESWTHVSPAPQRITLGDLLHQGRWEEAVSLIETDPNSATEKCQIHPDSRSAHAPCCMEQMILPLALVCRIYASTCDVVVPIGLTQLLVSSYPDGLKQRDSRSGSLPLHVICDSFGARGTGRSISSPGSEERRRFVAARLRVLRVLLKSHPFATAAADSNGRLPLHRALLAGAPCEAIRRLVYRDPRAIGRPDRNGMTPFACAQKLYPPDSPIRKLLELA